MSSAFLCTKLIISYYLYFKCYINYIVKISNSYQKKLAILIYTYLRNVLMDKKVKP